MTFRGKIGAILLILGASISARAIDKDTVKFQPEPAASYENKQAISGVTIAAQPFDRAEMAEKAFGKVNPYEHGVLPVLVVIQNDTKQAIRVDGAEIQYITPNRDHIVPTSANELPYLKGPKRPNFNGQYPIPLPKKKNPMANPVLQERAFAAKMIPPGDSAWGFFYFQVMHRGASRLYIKGLREASTGNELFYYEIPLDSR